MYRKLLRHLLTFLILLAWVGLAEACPTCKEGLADNSAHMVRGFGWSIIFMMSTPFILFTSLSAYFYYEVCKARRLALLEAAEAIA